MFSSVFNDFPVHEVDLGLPVIYKVNGKGWHMIPCIAEVTYRQFDKIVGELYFFGISNLYCFIQYLFDNFQGIAIVHGFFHGKTGYGAERTESRVKNSLFPYLVDNCE